MRLHELIGERAASATLAGRKARDIAGATRRRSNALRVYQAKLRSLQASERHPPDSDPAERNRCAEKMRAEKAKAADRYEQARTRADDATRAALARQ